MCLDSEVNAIEIRRKARKVSIGSFVKYLRYSNYLYKDSKTGLFDNLYNSPLAVFNRKLNDFLKEDRRNFNLINFVQGVVNSFGLETQSSYTKVLSALTSQDKLNLRIDPSLFVVSGDNFCLLYTSPSPRDRQKSRMPSSA